MRTAAAAKKPTGSYALSTEDPRWFPMAQGETLFRLMAGILKQTPEAYREAFYTGLLAELERNATATVVADAAPAPAKQRKRRG